MSEHLPQQSLFDWLRPDTGARTDLALISTYSASPGVIASLLLSLAGFEDDPTEVGARATRVKFARAVLQLRHRVSIAMQAGRLFSPRKSGKPLAVLDSFITQVPFDEKIKGGRSWHPKCALVRYADSASSAGKWRFWLGSRNLTRDTSWDLGLAIEGNEVAADVAGGTTIASIATVARKLAHEMDCVEQWKAPLRRLPNVVWDVPRGITIKSIDLLLPQEANRDLPACPQGVRRLIAVAPFIDAKATKRIGKWGEEGADKTLISTGVELNRLAKGSESYFENAGYDTVCALSPVAEEGEADADAADMVGVDPESSCGLHAKFLWVEHTKATTLWLGSPNLTDRAWRNNAEIVAQISIESRGSAKAVTAIKNGVEAFLSIAPEFSSWSVKTADDADDGLEVARNEVAAQLTRARQVLSADWTTVVIEAKELPHPANPKVVLKVGPVAAEPGDMIEWPRGSKRVRLRLRNPQAASQLVRITLEQRGRQPVSWLQSIPIEGFEYDKRDRLLFRQYLNNEQLLAWIYATLTGSADGDEGGAWDEDDGTVSTGSRRGKKRPTPLVPTLEDVLRAWLKNRSAFSQVDEIIKIYDSDVVADASSSVSSFRSSLELIKQNLNEPISQ